METRHISLVLALTSSMLGCRAGIDVEAERASLRQADQDWAATAAAGADVERIIAYWTDDAKVYPPGMPVVEGKAAIREFVAGSMQIPGFEVSWQPEEVIVSPDGQLGYTTGTNRFTAPDPQGNLVTTLGRYITVWRKESDGSWKCVIDIWNTGPT